MKPIFLILIVFATTGSFCQEISVIENNISINEFIDGTLLLPQPKDQAVLAIIISDYGPTDRNGNQNFLKNNSLKKLANNLSQKGIATFRYDKRTSKQLQNRNIVLDTSFDDFVTDARSVIAFFKSQSLFSKIYIVGHGQGSLVGMLALNNTIDGFISIGGSAKNIGDVILDQINATARQYVEDAKRVIAKLKVGETTRSYPKALDAMFNIDTQPFMISWIAYEPTDIIKKLDIPILVLNGSKDLQVPVDDAKSLADANQKARLYIIKNMNHVLFTIEGDNLENSKSYNESFRQINSELIERLMTFILDQN